LLRSLVGSEMCIRDRLVACAVFVAVAMTSPATAQSTGMVKGKVFDGKGQPIEAAKVTIEFKDGISRVYTVKSNKKGEYTQIGLPPGNYKAVSYTHLRAHETPEHL